ncbi:hypothetical protein [Streptomyces zaomyceticus]|uniref:hypothetical protein n=1 Tax=Streptomyces zaomyceticus TaxID=68286 RepID=UPI003422FA24
MSEDEHVCKPGATEYFCPATGEMESDCHGGFDVCCGQPERHVTGDELAVIAMEGEIARLRADVERLTLDLRVSEARVGGAALHVDRVNARISMLENVVTAMDGLLGERDRFKAAWQSARRRASTTREKLEHTRAVRAAWWSLVRRSMGASNRAGKAARRYRLAWLSARRRAAHESVMATAAVDHLRCERDRWRAGHERAEAQLVHVRRENERLRALLDEVR